MTGGRGSCVVLPPDLMLGYAGPMTVTLCIDTSTTYCRVALAVGDDVFADTARLERRHNEQVLPMLDSLYRRAGIAVMSTQLVSFAAGPGGFTGVRIAASIAQGVAMACNCKVVPQRGSSVIVNSWVDDSADKDRALCLVASRGQSFYLSEYAKASSQWVLKRPDELHEHAPPWLDDLAQGCADGVTRLAVLGVTPNWLPKKLSDSCVGAVIPSAQRMIDVAREADQRGDSVAAELALPIYVQGDSPWRKRG